MVRADKVPNAYDPEHDDQIAHLLKLAGRRRSPGTDQMRRAREAARVEWVRTLRARGRRRLVIAAAVTMAAGALASATWLWPSRLSPPGARPELATLQRMVGSLRLTDAAGREAIERETRVREGDRVEMLARSRAAFALADGTSVRLASDTLVVFDAHDRLRLERGTIYVDSNPAHRAGATAVETPFGRVSHVGTQFELRLQPASLNVRVREGEVVVTGRAGPLTSRAGESLLITRDRAAERSSIAISGPEWDWVTSIAQPFALEGSTVATFLHWVSREQGWRWEYADAATNRVAERAVLHGSIDGLTPEEALLAVLPASGLSSRRDGDRLIVSVR
jgi:ferric-dicitrate binding protein FerR (iron transport regulator)